MAFVLGRRSLAELEGVHPQLVKVVKRALELSTVDFGVHDGVRTVKEQKALFDAGASKTMKSKHLPQADGLGYAVDLVPWVNGKFRWEWGPIWGIAQAMDQAATELGVKVRWGAVWDKGMWEYGGSPEALAAEVEAYKVRHPGPDFLDGPHYELVEV